MKILITGGTGYLGTRLGEALRQQDNDVTSFGSRELDLRVSGALDRFRDVRFDRIYHLAAWTQPGDFALTHAGEQWIENQLIHAHTLQWWAAHQPQAKLVTFGTSAAYPEDSRHQEDGYLLGSPVRDLYTYAMTKRMLQVGLESIGRQWGLHHLTLVPSTVYGPGYPQGSRQRHFIFDILTKVLKHKHRGEPIVLWGDGHQQRELVYVDDFIGDVLALSERAEDTIVNIGAGELHSIRAFVDRVCALTGVDPGAVQYDTSRYVGARAKWLDVERLRSLRPDRKVTPLEVGLARTIEDFEARMLAGELKG